MDRKWKNRAALPPAEGQNNPYLPPPPSRPALNRCRAPCPQSDGQPYIAGLRIRLWIAKTENYSRVNAIRLTEKPKASVNLDHNRN